MSCPIHLYIPRDLAAGHEDQARLDACRAAAADLPGVAQVFVLAAPGQAPEDLPEGVIVLETLDRPTLADWLARVARHSDDAVAVLMRADLRIEGDLAVLAQPGDAALLALAPPGGEPALWAVDGRRALPAPPDSAPGLSPRDPGAGAALAGWTGGHGGSVRAAEAPLRLERIETPPAPAPAPPGFALWDHDWQFPAITERHAHARLQQDAGGALAPGRRYLAFPWATLIDNLLHNWQHPARADHLKRGLAALAPQLRAAGRVITTCQHIHMLEFQDLFHRAGVTDIFWSHAVKGQTALPDHPGIAIHPFPLYPVQAVVAPADPGRDRPLLYSFVGARANQWYLTEARNFILKELAGDPAGFVAGNDNWHYNRVVYDHQVRGTIGTGEALVDDAASDRFRAVMLDSLFALCPSGTGPNSIRLWEAIGLGAIPVILADTLALPGDPALWAEAAVFCPEDRDSIRALPARLAALRDDPAALARMRAALARIWNRYGPGDFIADIRDLLAAPPAPREAAPDPDLCLFATDLLLDPAGAARWLGRDGGRIALHYARAPGRQQADFLEILRAAGLRAPWDNA